MRPPALTALLSCSEACLSRNKALGTDCQPQRTFRGMMSLSPSGLG
jgi:hypothetical protein